MPALLSEASGLEESTVALPIMRGFVAATRGGGLVIPLLWLAVLARGLVIPPLRLAVLARGLVIPPLRLAVVARGLVIPSLRLVTVAPPPGYGMPSR